METIRIDRIRAYLLNGCALDGYVLNGYVLVGYVLNGYVLVGYVLNGYVWDMCGVRYANNLLKNPATKRRSGTKRTFLRNKKLHITNKLATSTTSDRSSQRLTCISGSCVNNVATATRRRPTKKGSSSKVI